MKNGKFLVVITAILVVICSWAQVFAAKIGEQEVVITLKQSYASRYMVRSRDYYPDDDPLSMTSIDIAFPKLVSDTDISFNVWWGLPLNSGHVIDEELHYSTTLSRNFLDSFNLSLGHIYFDFPKDDRNADCHEVWGSFTWLKLPGLPIPVSATLTGAYDFGATADFVFENGWFYGVSLNTALSLPDWKIFQKEQKLVLGITNWGNDGVLGEKPSNLYATEFLVSTDYCFKGFTISPGFHYAINHGEAINSGNEELWGSIDVSYKF